MNDPLGIGELRARNDVAERVYAALRSTGKLSSHRILTYRCERPRCLLLDVVSLPQGVIFHTPVYKLSPSANETTSSESGRTKNTRDGNRRWRERTKFASDCVNVALQCDHLRQVVLEKSAIQDDLDAGHADMVVLAAGVRQAR